MDKAAGTGISMLRRNNNRPRMDREKRTIEAMVRMYCSSYHKAEKDICQECAGLLGYAGARLDKCHFGEKKPPCAKCAIHCYSPYMRAKVTAVMRYAGPRMISKHPILALFHGIQR